MGEVCAAVEKLVNVDVVLLGKSSLGGDIGVGGVVNSRKPAWWWGGFGVRLGYYAGMWLFSESPMSEARSSTPRVVVAIH